MNIQVINFEVCKDHYLITKMVKTTSHNQIEYVPSYYYKKKLADCYLLINKQEENKIIDWCQCHEIPMEKTIVLTNRQLNQFIAWIGENVFEKDLDFEKVCQWLMTIKEKNPDLDLFINCTIRTGKIRKDHDYDTCLQSIMKQNPGLKKDCELFLFVKEKSYFMMNQPQDCTRVMQQYYLKGISETYDYMILNEK